MRAGPLPVSKKAIPTAWSCMLNEIIWQGSSPAIHWHWGLSVKHKVLHAMQVDSITWRAVNKEGQLISRYNCLFSCSDQRICDMRTVREYGIAFPRPRFYQMSATLGTRGPVQLMHACDNQVSIGRMNALTYFVSGGLWHVERKKMTLVEGSGPD